MKSNFILCLFFLGVVFFAPTHQLNAQGDPDYTTAIGGRFGSPFFSASYKTFLSDRKAIELYGSFNGFETHNFRSLSGAFQYHLPLNKLVEGLKVYSGAGLSTYFWSFDSNFPGEEDAVSVGINSYIGLDFKIPVAPITFTGDWTPTLFLNGYNTGIDLNYWSVGIRYVIKKYQ